ncbi:MAG TPA: DinB family protein [Gemmatimonadaceae bacterium]|nr:DinB family protein [Gemmatimonadaceae bacterium]
MSLSAETISAQCRYLIASAEAMLNGLNDEHAALEPTPGNKSAGWLLGHLCITGDFGRRLCGRNPIAPKEWRDTFRPGTNSGAIESYPAMDELCTKFREIYADLCDVYVAVDQSTLMTPNPFEPARPAFPTAAEMVPYLMTGHLGYHLGQLGDWRRAAGLGHKGHI